MLGTAGGGRCAEPICRSISPSIFPAARRTKILGPRTRFRHLPQVFSTANLKFLPYVPDHTDLSPWHPRLARELAQYDVIHTTDGFFAFARTAARVSRARGIPLVNSIHTDTPSYARIFTRNTIEKIFGNGWLGAQNDRGLAMARTPAARAWNANSTRICGICRAALATRAEDQAFAENILGPARVHHMRRGIDKDMFGPHRRDRAGIERDYDIPRRPHHCVCSSAASISARISIRC